MITSREIVFHGHFYNTLAGLVLSNSKTSKLFEDHAHVCKEIELKIGLRFFEARILHIGAEFKASMFFLGASVAKCKRHIRVAKTMLRCHVALDIVQAKASVVFGLFHRNDLILASSKNLNNAIFLCTTN